MIRHADQTKPVAGARKKLAVVKVRKPSPKQAAARTEPGSPDQEANEEQPDQSHGEQHDPHPFIAIPAAKWSLRGTEQYLLVTAVAGKTPIAPATARSGYA